MRKRKNSLKLQKDKNWANWYVGFLIYANVIVVCIGNALVHRYDIPGIYGVQWTGLDDEGFCRRGALNPSFRWGQIYLQLWMLIMLAA